MSKGPDLVINGRFLMQATTGVQRVARELTREIDHMIDEGEVAINLRLICEPTADISDLFLRATTVERVGGASGHLWEQVMLPRSLRGGRLLSLGNTAPMITLLQRRHVALMIHDLSYRLFPQAYSPRYRIGHTLLLPFLLRRASPILTVSETEKAMLSSLVPGARRHIVVAQNGGWRDDHATKMFIAPDEPKTHALYVGSFSRRKNYDAVIELAVRLARERNLPTVLAGSAGSFLVPSDIMIPSDVKDMIRFVGQVEDLAGLGELYRHAACLIFPSFYEASPLPPLEAMNFGCPVVASDIPSMRERCGDAAEYCDPYDIDDMMRAVRRVLDDPLRAQNLADRGYIQAAKYSWREQARSVLAAVFPP